VPALDGDGRRARARVAAATRWQNAEELEAAAADLAAAKIVQLAEAAPALSTERRARLARLLLSEPEGGNDQ
jgi:hypothetical protein